MLVNPAVSTERKDVKLLPVLKHVIPSLPGIANDIKKPGVEEYGYTKTPLQAAHSMFQACKVLRADLAEGHLPDPAVPLHRGPRRGPVERPRHPARRLLARRDASEMLEDSYHVATLDNDAQQIFEDSARVRRAGDRR